MYFRFSFSYFGYVFKITLEHLMRLTIVDQEMLGISWDPKYFKKLHNLNYALAKIQVLLCYVLIIIISNLHYLCDNLIQLK